MDRLGQEAANIDKVREPIVSAPTEVRQIIEQVLQLEKNKLYLKTPRNIHDDILTIIKNVTSNPVPEINETPLRKTL